MNKTRTGAALLGILGLAASGLVLSTGTASADPQWNQQFAAPWSPLGYAAGGDGADIGEIDNFPLANQWGEPTATIMCLDSPGGVYDGAALQLWQCNGGENQHWHQGLQADQSWEFYLTHANSNGSTSIECMDSLHGHDWRGAGVFTYPCNGGSSQSWTIGPGNQLQSVDAAANNLCLDSADWGNTNGAHMQLWTCVY